MRKTTVTIVFLLALSTLAFAQGQTCAKVVHDNTPYYRSWEGLKFVGTTQPPNTGKHVTTFSQPSVALYQKQGYGG